MGGIIFVSQINSFFKEQIVVSENWPICTAGTINCPMFKFFIKGTLCSGCLVQGGRD